MTEENCGGDVLQGLADRFPTIMAGGARPMPYSKEGFKQPQLVRTGDGYSVRVEGKSRSIRVPCAGINEVREWIETTTEGLRSS